MKNSNHNMIHQHETSGKFDAEHSIVSNSSEEARRLFSLASFRLLNVNQWHKFCGIPSWTFQLTDANGKFVTRPAKAGDYFRIDTLSEESSLDKEYDWERIEAMDDQRNPSADKESLAIRVKRAVNPSRKGDRNKSRSNENDAFGSFEVYRNRNVVTAEIHGRKENASEMTPKNQKFPAGTDILLGFPIPQWRSLIKGLLDPLAGQSN